MALLTAEEADRIVRANIEVSGATSDSLMAAWRGMVYAMLERLNLGPHRRDVITLAVDIVKLWSFVQPVRTYDLNHGFSFPDMKAMGPIGFFDELHRLAMEVLLATPELPPRDEPERARDVEGISTITDFAREQCDDIQQQMQSADSSYIRCSAALLTTAAECCQLLLRITLGRQFAQEFQQQYDECISAWTIVVPLVEHVIDPTEAS